MESKFTGGVLGLIGVWLAQVFMIIFTFGIALPWAVCFAERWYAEHTIIDGHCLTFDGRGRELFGRCIKWLLLTYITFGIYVLWLVLNVHKWVVSHTHTYMGEYVGRRLT